MFNNPCSMYTVSQIHETEPLRSETIKFESLNPDKVNYPDKEFVHILPSYTTRFECITPNSDGSKRTWKSFEHYKSVLGEASASLRELTVPTEQWAYRPNHYVGKSGSPYSAYVAYYNGGSTYEPFGDAGRLNIGLPGFYQPRPDGGFVPPPDDLDSLLTRALRSMLPSIKAEMSLVNSLIELKDFKDLPKHLLNTSKFLKKWHFSAAFTETQTEFFKGKPLKWFKDHIREGAGDYLQWKFNIGPFISDIMAIFAIVSRAERQITDLMSRANRPQNKHYVYKWEEFPDTYYNDEDYNVEGYFDEPNRLNPLALYSHDRTVRNNSTVFHAQTQYSYDYSAFQAAHAQLLGVLDMMGVNLNPQIIWNALPWSFVVDWLVGIGQWYGQFKLENMKPRINIRRFCWSVKRQRQILVTTGVSRKTSVYAPTYNRTRLPVVYETAYRRNVGLPSVSSLTTSGLSLGEFSLAAALMVTRKHRRSTGQWRTMRR